MSLTPHRCTLIPFEAVRSKSWSLVHSRWMEHVAPKTLVRLAILIVPTTKAHAARPLGGVETPMRTVVPAVNLVHVPKPNLPKSTTQNHDRTVDAAQEKAAVLLAMQMGHLVAVVHPSGGVERHLDIVTRHKDVKVAVPAAPLRHHGPPQRHRQSRCWVNQQMRRQPVPSRKTVIVVRAMATRFVGIGQTVAAAPCTGPAVIQRLIVAMVVRVAPAWDLLSFLHRALHLPPLPRYQALSRS